MDGSSLGPLDLGGTLSQRVIIGADHLVFDPSIASSLKGLEPRRVRLVCQCGEPSGAKVAVPRPDLSNHFALTGGQIGAIGRGLSRLAKETGNFAVIGADQPA